MRARTIQATVCGIHGPISSPRYYSLERCHGLSRRFSIAPIGKAKGLKTIVFRGQVPIDPHSQDFFKAVIEERIALPRVPHLSETERDRLKRSLKTLGERDQLRHLRADGPAGKHKEVALTCFGIDPEPYRCKVKHPEAPGEYCFPPLASLITSGGHLLLALLERLVADCGGTYAMEDTDSMAIVASKHGGLVACPGGPYHARRGARGDSRVDPGNKSPRSLRSSTG